MSALKERIGDRRVVASISGGKDSAAMSLWFTEQGIDHDRVFADTGWEHPDTYEYLRGPLTEKLGPIVEVRGERPMVDLIRHKGMFPSRVAKFCSQELKFKPIQAYLLSRDDDHINAIAIRAEESANRADPTQHPEWEWSADLDCEVWRPLLAWTFAEVAEIHRRHGLSPNPLYLRGASRVGCWPCISARKNEIALVARTDPDRIALIRSLEEESERAWRARISERGEEVEAEEPPPHVLHAPPGRQDAHSHADRQGGGVGPGAVAAPYRRPTDNVR